MRPSDNFESPESFHYFGPYHSSSRSVRAMPKPFSEHRTIAVPTGNSILAQCRKPSGWLGRFLLWKMNRQHSQLTDWGLTHISIGQSDTILDVGCGGGRTVSVLAAAASQSKVYGLDYSHESVAASTRNNARSIASGHVQIRQESVSQLPFSDGMFDLVTAVETHYYWPDLPADLREILRVPKPGGVLVSIAEAYKGANSRMSRLAEKYLDRTGMTLLRADEHCVLFENAGYQDVRVIENDAKGWICCIGRRP